MSLNCIRNYVRSHAVIWLQQMEAYLTIWFLESHGASLHKQSAHTHALNAFSFAKEFSLLDCVQWPMHTCTGDLQSFSC